MDYTQVIPAQITKLPKYAVPRQLFICTCLVLVVFLFLSVVIIFQWIYRTIHGYTNTDYIPDYVVKLHAEQTLRQLGQQNQQQSKQFKQNCKKMSRLQSRILQFWSLMVIVVINIGTFTCNIMECVGFVVAVVIFFSCNVFRFSENRFLRSAWIFPIIICYLPYYIFPKSLIETQ